MDQRLKQALEQADLRLVKLRHIEQLRLKLEQELVYAFNGAIFDITPELISYIDALQNADLREGMVLDRNKRPVFIDDLSSFKRILVAKHQKALRIYGEGFHQVANARTIEEVLGE